MDSPDNILQSSVDHISIQDIKGPWQTKSGGELNVIFSLSFEELEKFLDYTNPEFDKISTNIRGLRSYCVDNIPEGSIGAMEWHKARTEMISAVAGRALLECVDLEGRKRKFILNGEQSIIIPPNILHTYTSLTHGTKLRVIANTLFSPDDASTHDTYTKDSFYDLLARDKK